jgi:predicted metal-dependent phosphotriesterase family hydrolase
MAELADEAGRYAIRAGASGWTTDEGDEHRRAVFEYSRLDALTVARWGDYGEYARHCANSKDRKKQIAVADWIADADAARAAGVKVIPDVTERQLGKAEFFARRAAGVRYLMETGHYSTEREAEFEWMKREAEIETGFTRDDPNPSRHKKYWKAYRALQRHDWS